MARSPGRIVDNVLDQENDPTFRYGGAPKAVPQGTTADIVVADRIDPDLATVFVLRPRVIVAGAADVEFCLRPSATSVKLRLVVDGKWLSITTLDGLTAHTDHYVRFQFPTAKAREIELQIPYSNIAFGGAATSSSGTLIRPRAKKGPKVAFLGDNFTGGAGAVTSIETHAGYVARLLGAGDWRNYGIGGSGYVTSQVFADRVESIVAWKPDIVVILGSRNDGSAYSATVRAAAVSVIDALQDVPLVVVSGPSQAGLEGMRDTVRDAAIIAGRPFVDTLGVITPALIDNVHPTVEGHRALARVLYDGGREALGVGISQTTVITAPTDPDPDPQPTTDPILTTGSLLLVDPTYAGSEWPAGVPAHGSTVPNAAWQKAAAVLGSGDATTLAAGIKRIDNSPTTLVLERTSKGALHGIFSQTTTTQAAAASNQIQADIVLPDALRSYLVANPSNDIYLSIWTHTTRLSTDVSNSAYAAILSNATTATNLLAVTQSATLPLGSDSARLLGRTVGTNATTRQRRSVASSAGTPDANIDAYAATWGNSTVMNRSVRGSGQSYVLYRVYMEHLTVSGRTFAAVDALDNDDAYTAALAAGGRYAGDTWTDPTTIP